MIRQGRSRRLVRIIILLMLMMNCVFLESRSSPVRISGENYVPEHWKTPEWLAGSSISSIAQTPDGYLWLSSPKGLIRFDGVRFIPIQYRVIPPEDKKKKVFPGLLYVDRDGILWIASPGSLTRYNYKNGRFKTYTGKDGMTGNRITQIQEDINGDLWIGFLVGYMNRFEKSKGNDGRFIEYNYLQGLTGKKVRGIIEDANGNIWVTTRENGLFVHKNGAFKKFEFRKSWKTGEGRDRYFTGMCECRDGYLLVGTVDGLFRISPVTGKTECYSIAQGLSGNMIIDFLTDRYGKIWVATDRGLEQMVKDREGNVSFKTIVRNVPVYTIYEDSENTIWITTSNAGLISLKPATFVDHPVSLQSGRTSNLNEEVMTAIAQVPGGDIWFGSITGRLLRYNGNELIESITLPGLSNTSISAIQQDEKGNLWIGTLGSGVFRVEPETRRITTFTNSEGLADNQVISIFRDSKDYLWIGTYDGLTRYRNGSFQSIKADQGVKGNFVNNVYEDKEQNIWLATNKGLYIIKNGTINPDFIDMTEYLPDIPITCILMEEDTVWMSTHGAGLKRFKKGMFNGITTAHGLGSDFVYQMMPDSNGNIWLQADFDVLRVNKNQLNRFADGETDSINTIHYGVSDGLKSNRFFNTFSRNSVLKTKEGNFLFATHRGVSVVDPSSIRINKQPPQVVIEYLLLVRSRGYGDQWVTFPRPQEEEFFWQANIWQFYFTAPSFLSPEKVRFKYKLDGFEEQWRTLPPGRRRIAIYKNLCAGEYTFRVKGCNSDGVWSAEGASFQFTVKMCFSQTWIFKLMLISAGLLAAVGLLLLFRKWKQKKEKNHRYRCSHLNQLYVREILKNLEHQMKVKKIYRDENLTLQVLASKLSIHSRYLSQVINENLDMNFSDYINKNRIEEAKKLLADPQGRDRKILAVAFEVGFNTKASFNIAFKKHTGMTPSQYRNKVS